VSDFYNPTPRPRGKESLWNAALLALPLTEYTVFIDPDPEEGYADVTCTRCLGRPPKHLSTAFELGRQADMREVLAAMMQHEADHHGGIPHE
jgi:hypothetical protein